MAGRFRIDVAPAARRRLITTSPNHDELITYIGRIDGSRVRRIEGFQGSAPGTALVPLHPGFEAARTGGTSHRPGPDHPHP